MRQGVFFPPFDGVADPHRLVELGRTAEAAGCDGIFLWDHLLYAGGVTKILDPYISLAAIASATTTIQLGAMVTPLNRRRPQIVARQAVTLDLLSNGRLILEFGIGDDGESGELSKFGETTDAKERGRMLSEGLEVLTGLLSGDPPEASTTKPMASRFNRRPRVKAAFQYGSPHAGPIPRQSGALHTTAASSSFK
jgi:alkanesulfonate monooxygenase SsuD/methylene tetrahydromethanopterin reductase-like flavin-dependent oxidoreductase (luciferase family)